MSTRGRWVVKNPQNLVNVVYEWPLRGKNYAIISLLMVFLQKRVENSITKSAIINTQHCRMLSCNLVISFSTSVGTGRVGLSCWMGVTINGHNCEVCNTRIHNLLSNLSDTYRTLDKTQHVALKSGKYLVTKKKLHKIDKKFN